MWRFSAHWPKSRASLSNAQFWVCAGHIGTWFEAFSSATCLFSSPTISFFDLIFVFGLFCWGVSFRCNPFRWSYQPICASTSRSSCSLLSFSPSVESNLLKKKQLPGARNVFTWNLFFSNSNQIGILSRILWFGSKKAQLCFPMCHAWIFASNGESSQVIVVWTN